MSAMLRPADDLLIIEALARSLMAEHELDGWRFKWDRAKARAGQCNYRDKTISLSLYYVERYGYMEVRDTILHEIAHALAGPGTGHGWVWKQTCRAIGAAPERLLGGALEPRSATMGTLVPQSGGGTVMDDRIIELLRVFGMGVKDAFEQGELGIGMTWENDDAKNEAYDYGANLGESLARASQEKGRRHER